MRCLIKGHVITSDLAKIWLMLLVTNDKKTGLLQKQSLFFNKIEKRVIEVFNCIWYSVQNTLDADYDIIRNSYKMETFQGITAHGTERQIDG